jgi:hypothetical protein
VRHRELPFLGPEPTLEQASVGRGDPRKTTRGQRQNFGRARSDVYILSVVTPQ